MLILRRGQKGNAHLNPSPHAVISEDDVRMETSASAMATPN